MGNSMSLAHVGGCSCVSLVTFLSFVFCGRVLHVRTFDKICTSASLSSMLTCHST